MEITSINNPKVKEWMKLKEKKYRDREKCFIIEGDHLIREAIIKGVVKEIITTEKCPLNSDIPYYHVTEAIIKKLSNQVSSSKSIAICHKLENEEIKGNVCLLDQIQDPGNLGTIIRSAVAFNIQTLIMSNDTVDLYNEKVIRASEGMLFHLNYIKGNLSDSIHNLKKLDYKIYGTDVHQGTPLKDLSFSKKTGIIIGNEGKGMNDNLKELCDELIYIPINSVCESLNAGVAASIIFYEMGGF